MVDERIDEVGYWPRTRGDWMKHAAIAGLFLGKIFPFGFITLALPAVYRQLGLPLEQFWVFSLATIPFWLKWLVAPLADRFGSVRFGYRMSWILPATAFSAATYLCLSFYEPTLERLWVIVAIFCLNQLAVAMTEVGVYAYAAENLEPREQGFGSMIMLAADNIGYVFATIAIVALYESYGWTAALTTASGLLLLAIIPAVVRREPPPPPERLAALRRGDRPSLVRLLRRPEAPGMLAVQIVGGLQKGLTLLWYSAFLVDKGVSLGDIGIATGIALGVTGIVGAVVGPPIMARLGPLWTMRLSALLLLSSFGVMVAIANATSLGRIELILAMTWYEASVFLYIALLVASQMRWSDRGQVATDMTFQSAAFFLGTTIGSAVSGPLAAALGWPVYFMAIGLFSAATAFHFIFWYPRIEAKVAARGGAGVGAAAVPAI